MNMLLERPAPLAGARIGEDLERLEALKASVRSGEIQGEALAALRMQCDRELSELRTELDLLLADLRRDLKRMQTERRSARRAA